MDCLLELKYDVFGNDFIKAGEASSNLKVKLKSMGYDKNIIKRVCIAMYEGEINMVIHAGGGVATVKIYPDKIEILLKDNGPGIEDLQKAMKAGYSTAPDNVRSLGFGAGMGLPNIKKYTDEMKIETEKGKGTTVFMRINAKRS